MIEMLSIDLRSLQNTSEGLAGVLRTTDAITTLTVLNDFASLERCSRGTAAVYVSDCEFCVTAEGAGSQATAYLGGEAGILFTSIQVASRVGTK
jgi:hypothetical protein